MIFKKILTIFFITFLWSNVTQAKIPAIFGSGHEVFEIGPFPAETIEDISDLKDFKAAYKCKHFAIFWADIRTWDCSLVAINPAEKDTYYELPADIQSGLQSKPEYQQDKMQRSFWNHYGIFIIILAIIGFFVIGRFKKS